MRNTDIRGLWEGKQKWKQRERDKERKQVNANKKQELGDRFCVILCFFLGVGGGGMRGWVLHENVKRWDKFLWDFYKGLV